HKDNLKRFSRPQTAAEKKLEEEKEWNYHAGEDLVLVESDSEPWILRRKEPEEPKETPAVTKPKKTKQMLVLKESDTEPDILRFKEWVTVTDDSSELEILEPEEGPSNRRQRRTKKTPRHTWSSDSEAEAEVDEDHNWMPARRNQRSSRQRRRF
ncbi:unnamed protein product, partial [Auanema sp. JU1783]